MTDPEKIETVARNVLQDVGGWVRDQLETMVQAGKDDAVRKDILRSLGLDPGLSATGPAIPDSGLAGIDAYRQKGAGDADLQSFIEAMQDVTQIIQAFTDWIALAIQADAGAPIDYDIEQAATIVLNMLTLGAIRRDTPALYITARALQLIEDQSIEFGNVTDLIFKTGDYFNRLRLSFAEMNTEEDAKRVSDVLLFLTGVGGGWLAGKLGVTEYDFVYGYDPGPPPTAGGSPVADTFANRALTMRFRREQEVGGADLTAGLVIGAVIVPGAESGVALRLQAESELVIPITPNLKLVLAADSPDLVFFVGHDMDSQPPVTGDASAKATLTYESTGPFVLRPTGPAKGSPASGTSETWTVEALPEGFTPITAADDGQRLIDPEAPGETILVTASDGKGDTSITVIRGADSTTPVEHEDTATYHLSRPIVLGDPKGIHIRFGKIAGGASIADTAAGLDFEVKGQIKDNVFVIATDEADGFLKTVLNAITPNGRLVTTFSFEAGVSRKRGFFVGGGAGLTLAIPLHKKIGGDEAGLILDTLVVGLSVGERPGKPAGIALEGSLSFSVNLLGSAATIDRLGLEGIVAFDGWEFSLGFKPPNGAGLSINAGPVTGGGFLLFDRSRGEYAGGVELNVADVVSVTAIALISTHLPDGKPGFSILVAISVEKLTVQVGMGFQLIGLGLIGGWNRGMRLDALAAGAKTGGLERVLFPHDIVANAARIISDLNAFFPVQNDSIVIGVMAKLTWGTSSLFTLSLGVVFQTSPFTVGILGLLEMSIPRKTPVLQLKIAFVGALELDKHRAWLFATLYDSHLLTFTLEGGLGALVQWGDTPNLVISVGGFHPQFTPPPLPFPVPDRIAISILNEKNARLRATAYVAVTSNTVQFGAAVEAFFGFDSVQLSGHLALDALFQFTPFHFVVEISASFQLKVFGTGVFSVRLRGSLEGASPWRIAGAASISFFFFSISVEVERTWGDAISDPKTDVSVLPLLASELTEPANWKAELSSAAMELGVSLRDLSVTPEALILHPLGQLRISQRTVPLGIRIDTVGTSRAADAHRFDVSLPGGGGGVLRVAGPSKEQFAIAQYQELSDAAKLSAPCFQLEPGGIVLQAAGSQLRSSRLVKRRVRYELVIVDSNFLRSRQSFFGFWRRLFDHFTTGSVMTRAEASYRRDAELHPFDEAVSVRPGRYVVAQTADNTIWATTPAGSESRTFDSEADAREFLDSEVAGNHRLADALHVIPRAELQT
jgi:hypothetical protein